MIAPVIPSILATSFLLILSFPRPDLGFLSFISLVPLLWAVSRLEGVRAFLAGWSAAWVWFFASYRWVSHSISRFGDIPFPLDQAIIALLAGVHALYPGLFAVFSVPFLRQKGTGALLFLPSLWVLLELVRAWVPAPFPWLPLGASLWKTPFLRPLFSVVGVYGLSFFVVLLNVLVWKLFRRERGAAGTLAVVLGILAILSAGGAAIRGKGSGETIRAGVVQGNIEQDVKWAEPMVDEAIRVHMELTAMAVDQGARLIVWPETALPFVFESEPALAASISRFVSRHDIHLIFGSPAFEFRGDEVFIYNRAYHLGPDGVAEHYDKIVLVPFGEYVPFRRFLGFVDRLVPGEGDFGRGTWKGPMSTRPVPSGALICFEAAFPSLARREVRDGSGILVNITNDGWFGKTWGPYQHLALAAVRSAENGVPLLRAANTGVSAIVDRKGRVLERIPLDTRGLIVADVETGGPTLYTRFGDWIVFVALAVITINIYSRIFPWRPIKWSRSKPSEFP